MQSHGKRAEVRDRSREELMDVTDFVSWKMSRGLSEQDAENAWKQLLETDVGREGEGADTKVWVEKNKERFKDTVRYKDNQLQEGSRQMKDMPDTDRPGQLSICCFKSPGCACRFFSFKCYVVALKICSFSLFDHASACIFLVILSSFFQIPC